jgi:hypothetical protein
MSDLAGIDNPFRVTVVPDPWQPNVGDVTEIHERPFHACVEALEAVRHEGQTRSVLLFGEPGSGKTHLLRRLRAHWIGEPPHEVDPIRPAAVFVAAKLQTSPQHLWRYVRQGLVDDMMRPITDDTTLLERVLLLRFAEVRPADADLLMWREWVHSEHPKPDDLRAFIDELLDRIDAREHLGRDLSVVLGYLFLGEHRRDARAWLRGDSLPESALEALGLVSPPADVPPEDQAREVVGALCRLAGPTIPVVFAFDQIEALQTDRQDKSALFAFGRVVMELFQATRNVLIVSCVLSTFLDDLQDGMLRAAWDRLAMHREALESLDWPTATRLIAARLDASPALRGLRVDKEALWPLEESALRKRLSPLGESPRRILGACGEAFDRLRIGVDQPARPPEERLREEWSRRLASCLARSGTERSVGILAQGLPLLVQTFAFGWKTETDDLPGDVDILLRGPAVRLGIHLSHKQDMRGVWRPLERLTGLLKDGKVDRVVVVRDARLPLKPSVRERLDELRRAGGKLVQPRAEVLAALDAIRVLLSDARSGDLTESPETVASWLAREAAPELREFLGEVLAGPPEPTDDELLLKIVSALETRPVRTSEELATELGASVVGIENACSARPDLIGRLEGPTPVFFRLVPEPIEA